MGWRRGGNAGRTHMLPHANMHTVELGFALRPHCLLGEYGKHQGEQLEGVRMNRQLIIH